MPPDKFRAWIRKRGVRATAVDLAVSTQTVYHWLNGGGVRAARMPEVITLARQEHVALTATHLLPRTA